MGSIQIVNVFDSEYIKNQNYVFANDSWGKIVWFNKCVSLFKLKYLSQN